MNFFSIIAAAVALIGLFVIIPIGLGILLPIFIALFISKKFFAKGLQWKAFTPLVIIVLSLTVFANFIWQIFVFNKIYYEWDRISFIPFTLTSHESPLLNGMGTWIAPGWTLNSLQLLFLSMLVVLYFSSFLISLAWFKVKHKLNYNTSFIKTLLSFIVILLTLTFIAPFVGSAVSSVLFTFQTKPVQRVEKFIACPRSSEQNRIYYGSNHADYISSSDGTNIQKIWEKPGSSGDASGIPSPDKSRIAYTENDGIWIKCTSSDGIYKIPFESKYISGHKVSARNLVGGFSWAPDSVYLVLNYKGDLVKVNTDTKEKTIIYQNIAFKDNTNQSNPQKSSGWFLKYDTGIAIWSKSNFIYYTKFIDNDGVELRRISPEGEDKLILSTNHPLRIDSISPNNNQLLIYEQGWNIPQYINYSAQYIYDLNKKTKENIPNNINYNQSTWSGNNRLLASHPESHQIDSRNDFQFTVKDLQTQQSFDIKQKVKKFLTQQKLWNGLDTVTIGFKDWSQDDKLLMYVFFKFSNTNDLIITSDYKGDEIKIIFTNRNNNKSQPLHLYPKSWL